MLFRSVREYYDGGGIPFITPGDLGSHLGLRTTTREIAPRGLEVSRPVTPGSVCFVSIGSTIGKVGLSFFRIAATNQQINSVLPDEGFDPRFVCLLLWHNGNRIANFANPGPVPILNKATFESVELPVPRNKQEQIEIAEVIWPIEEALEISSRKHKLLRDLFSVVLDRLMTGALRADGVDIAEVTRG